MKPKNSEWTKVDSLSFKMPTPQPKKEQKKTSSFKHFLDLLHDNDFDSFSAGDWRYYFKYKADEHKIKLTSWSPAKENSIIKSLMTNYTVSTIKNLIDFIWDAPHDIKDKRMINIWILSKGWMQTVYPLMEDWINGELNKNKKHEEKEWKSKPNEQREESERILI